jgi:DNA polymerase (family 10)
MTFHHGAPAVARSLTHAERRERPLVRTNDEVAALLTEYADLTSITGGDRFRIRVYERAARSVAGYPVDLGTLDGKGLREAP